MNPTLTALLAVELAAAELDLKKTRDEREAVRARRNELANLDEQERSLNRKITLSFARVKAARVLLGLGMGDVNAAAMREQATRHHEAMA